MRKNKLGIVSMGLALLACVVGCDNIGRVERFGDVEYSFNGDNELKRVVVGGEEMYRRQGDGSILDSATYVPIAGSSILFSNALLGMLNSEINPVHAYTAPNGQLYWEERYKKLGGNSGL